PYLVPLLLLSPRRRPPRPTLFPYTTLFRSHVQRADHVAANAQRESRLNNRVRQKLVAAVNRIRRAHTRHNRLVARCHLTDDALRSEEHTSELQSRENLVCRLLLEKKKQSHG